MFKSLCDYFLFRKMLSPILMQICFWFFSGYIVYFGWWLISKDFDFGWFVMIFGVLVLRIIFELGMIMFRIYEKLDILSKSLDRD